MEEIEMIAAACVADPRKLDWLEGFAAADAEEKKEAECNAR